MMNILAGSGTSVAVTVSPDSATTFGSSSSNDSSHTVTVTGGTATSYLWSTSYPGSIVSGGSNASATLRVTDDFQGDLNPALASFTCDVVVNGITYPVIVSKSHDWQ